MWWGLIYIKLTYNVLIAYQIRATQIMIKISSGTILYIPAPSSVLRSLNITTFSIISLSMNGLHVTLCSQLETLA
jgi:hypothetical protein